MRFVRSAVRYISAVIVLAGCGWAGWAYSDLGTWTRVSSGLLVVLSVLAAAVFVRLARPSPFSNPDVFTTENIDRYFDALTTVAQRLAAILAVIGVTVVCVIGVIILAPPATAPAALQPQSPLPEIIDRGIPALLSVLIGFLFMRFVSVVHGDIGFIRLQREISHDARSGKAASVAGRIMAQPTEWKSSGEYGRVVGQ